MGKNCDFSGWATKADLLCTDGRIIRKNAFEHCDGTKVPLCWNHSHNRPEEVLGHAMLENRDEGVYAYCYFNETDSAQAAKECVRHGDINQLSIYANKLKQMGRDVIHGVICEVSLVHRGANPGAYIDSVLMHGDDSFEEGEIFTGLDLDYVSPLIHADNSEKGEKEVAEETKKPEAQAEGENEETIADVLKTFNEKQMKALYALLGHVIDDESSKKSESSEKSEVKHADAEADDDNETVEDVIKTFNPKQEKVFYALLGQVLDEKGEADEDNEDEEEDDEDVEGGNNNMKHNVFDQDTNKEVLTHADMEAIMESAQSCGSLKKAVLQHGITDVEYLFPDAQTLDKVPGFIKRDDTWVADVMNAVHHTPFSRIKSVFADITEADARAKGYIKGNLKLEEFFGLVKRETTPTTVYKKQSMHRDDVIDIKDFDVVAWLKTEMRMMLNEELARAILVGDGRSTSSNDKINEQNIRPIWKDDDIFTVKAGIEINKAASDDEKAKAFIRTCIKSRKHYKGSGNPVMFMSEDMLTNCLLLEDMNGRVIYDTMDKLATALRVKKIVSVPVMEGLTRIVGPKQHELAGIYVNLTDYNVGADKGGAISMFEDFDIDYNAQKYLLETRCSGALTVPFSAVAIEFVTNIDE